MKEDLKQIHESSMQILEEVGIKVLHPAIIEILRDNGVKVVEQTAFFTRDQVMQWIAKAPAEFTIYARNPKHDMHIGRDQYEYGSGYGCPKIVEADGKRRDALLSDYITFLKLIQQSPYFRLNGGIVVQPSDLDAKQAPAAMLYATILYSDKCLMGIPGETESVQTLMDMAALVFGGTAALSEKPRIITLVNTTSPLQLDPTALSTMLVCAKNRQPVIISPGPIAGATGPISLAGNIVLGNAEALAAIATLQMIESATPVVYGLQATTADMKTGSISIGSPGFALQAAYCARLSKMYGLPCRSGGTSNDAKGVSVQSGYESMLAMLTCRQENVNLILHSAGILDSYSAMSYEQFLVDLEIIGMIDYYLNGIRLDADALSVDLIKKVGPGGQFLSQPDTMRKCRIEPWMPEISFRGPLKNETVHEAILKNIQQKKEKMLNAYEMPPIDEAIKSKLTDYLDRIGIDSKSLEKE